MTWLVTVWFSVDPDDFIELRISPCANAEEAIGVATRLIEAFEVEPIDMAATVTL